MRVLIHIVFCLLAMMAYLFAPEGYNHTFCTTMMGLFLADTICWFLTSKRKDWLGFEFFFAISFFCVNYIYPVIYLPSYAHYSFYMYEFNRLIINQATALATMGYSFLLLGASLGKEEPHATTHIQFPLRVGFFRCIALIALVNFGLFVVTGGYAALASVYSGGGDLKDVGLYSYFNCVFTLCCLMMAALIFQLPREKWPAYLAILGFFVLLLLSTGSRQLSISIVLILLVAFSRYVYQFRWWQILLILFSGTVVLFLVVTFRKQGLNPEAWGNVLNSRQNKGFWDLFNDLTINGLNLYVLVDWGNTHALTWFHGMLIDLSSPIPHLSTWVIHHFSNEAPEMLQGGDMPSYILLGRNAGWGTGTNLIGELYRSFGVWGMNIFMLGLGWLMQVAYRRSNGNIYWYVFFFLMSGHALIYPRAPILYDPRTILWSLLIIWILTNVYENLRYDWLGKEEQP